jgi:DNA phosphorothioation-dependent restriction protein DptG
VRIEFELLNHFCKWYKYKDYLQLVEKLRDSMKVKYLWKVFYEYNDEPDFNRVYERVRYFKDFIWRWYRILENWYNPFVILYEGLKDKNVREEELVDLVYKLYEKVWNR